MVDVWGVLGALLVIVVPLVLAAWLLDRADRSQHRSRRRPHGKMPDSTRDRPHAD
jgi:hypothetical protein